MQKKSGIMKSGLDSMPLFLLDDLLRHTHINADRINKEDGVILSHAKHVYHCAVTDVEASNFNGVMQITIGVSVQMNGFPNA